MLDDLDLIRNIKLCNLVISGVPFLAACCAYHESVERHTASPREEANGRGLGGSSSAPSDQNAADVVDDEVFESDGRAEGVSEYPPPLVQRSSCKYFEA